MDRPLDSGAPKYPPEIVGDPDLDYDKDGNPIGVTIEYDEHGNPTEDDIRRWLERGEAVAQYFLDQVNESIAESRRRDAEKIAAGIDPGPHIISRESLVAAGCFAHRENPRKKPANSGRKSAKNEKNGLLFDLDGEEKTPGDDDDDNADDDQVE